MWQRDILGGDWVSWQFALPKLRGREAVSTLITKPEWLRRRSGEYLPSIRQFAEADTRSLAMADAVLRTSTQPPKTAILYLPGYNDYFFHTHLADYLESLGVAFFALDLHGYGRSTLDEESRNNAHSLREYGHEISVATKLIKEQCGYENLVVMGHSTGGLVASLWSHSPTGRSTVDGLVLNSPWFDLNRSWFDRVVGTAMLDAVGNYVTDYVITNDPSPYTRMLHSSHGGLWDFDLELKRERSTPVRSGWLRAIREGHARVAQGLGLTIPVLVCTSDRSSGDQASDHERRSSDTVLDVQQIRARALMLGRRVDIVAIEGGVHDLALSSEGPRRAYFEALAEWLRGHGFAPQHAAGL